jgi:hypothetical protein
MINFSTELDKKDLEVFCRALYKENFKLKIELERVQEKVEHLEMLLKGADVLHINGKVNDE